MGRNKKYVISLTDDEVRRLKSVLRKKTTTRTIKCRCQILLDLDEAHGKPSTHQQCVKSIGVCFATVHNVIKYYIDGGVEKEFYPSIEVSIRIMPVGKSMVARKQNSLKWPAAQSKKAVPDGPFAFWKRRRKLNLKFPLARMPSEEP